MRIFFILFFIIVGGIGCAGGSVDENNPESVYNDAEADVKASRYLQALEKLKNVKNKFPYSQYATKAQLRIADVHYAEEQFADAAAAFESFRDLHPKHEKADYVIFMIGESYFGQLPSSEDRDLTPAKKAIDAYKELLSLYPKAENTSKAQEHLKESTEKLALKEKYIGDFYYKREMWDSAAKRFEKITTNYSNTAVEQYAYWFWGKSLLLKTSNSEDDKEKAKLTSQVVDIYKVYLTRYPEGEYAKNAKAWLEEIGANGN